MSGVKKGEVFFQAPKDINGTGMFIGGGYHPFVEVQDAEGTTLSGIVLPSAGNWQSLAGLGFVAVPVPEQVAAAEPATDLPDALDPATD